MIWVTAEVGSLLEEVDRDTAFLPDRALEETGYPAAKVPALIAALGASGERDFNRRGWVLRRGVG